MRKLSTRYAALLLGVTAIAAAGCGSSSSSKSQAAAPAPATPSTATTFSSVAQGNAPVKVAFSSPTYLATCEKSLQTPNSQGHAFSHREAVAECGCVQKNAEAQGLGSKSEATISNTQFAQLFSTCLQKITGGASSAPGTTT
jgi:hypothetical protein